MKTEISPAQIFSFFRKNWFTLGLLVIGLYVYFRKDLSFQIQVQSPDKQELEMGRQPKEKMTENALGSNNTIDKLELPFIGERGGGSKDAFSELAKVEEADKQAFMERFAKVALAEQKKFGIPASIVLGTSLYQSYAGKREIAVAANNFFALPCAGAWAGNCVEAQGYQYRRYATAWDSFRDFSLFAKSNLGQLKGKGYREWAAALQQAGIGNGQNLIAVIEAYKLFQLDNL
jgi:hypothetical protein